MPQPPAPAAVPGFTDAHTHLLEVAAGVPAPWETTGVAEFHRAVAAAGSTPMDVPEPALSDPADILTERLRAGVAVAAAAGLVEITDMGSRSWWYVDALNSLQDDGPLPVRVRIYLASGLTQETSLDEMDRRRAAAAGPWLRLDGVKFYSDGWLGPRTCAMCRPFHDGGGDGLLFMDAATLARRIEPLAGHGWRIATHAIGDRAVRTVLDAYEMAWGGDRAALSAAAPRIEHASVQSAELIARMAETGTVACLQPSFAVSDTEHVRQALAPEDRDAAYPWAALAEAGVRMLAGTDFPIEVLEPLPSLARLVLGRSARPGFATPGTAPEGSRLPPATAFALLTDAAAGQTLLSADPREIPAAEIDHLEVLGTRPEPFAPAGEQAGNLGSCPRAFLASWISTGRAEEGEAMASEHRWGADCVRPPTVPPLFTDQPRPVPGSLEDVAQQFLRAGRSHGRAQRGGQFAQLGQQFIGGRHGEENDMTRA